MTDRLARLRRAFRPCASAHPDGRLLQEFVAAGAQADPAFTALVRRHGPLVWRACRSALPEPDAEDAFQATFLVLARRAPLLAPRQSLGPWLFEVARRITAQARRTAARRHRLEREVAAQRAVRTEDDRNEVAAVVHEEVARLPAGLRTAVVLCDLQGLTYQEAASQLGWTVSTVRGRLARARARLRDRLARQGLGSAALPPVVLPRALTEATTRAATALLLGRTAGAVPAQVMTLMTGGIHAMLWSKLKTAGWVIVAALLLVTGVGLLGQAQSPAPTKVPPGPNTDPLAGVPDGAAPDLADRLARLARKAHRLESEGDVAEARQTLRQVEQVLQEWQGRLGGDRGKRRGMFDPPDQPKNSARAATATLPFGPTSASATTAAVGTGPSARATPELETRLRDLERKLDRVLQALEGERTTTPRRNAPAR